MEMINLNQTEPSVNTIRSQYYQFPSRSQVQNSKELRGKKIYNIRERTFKISQRILEIVEMIKKNSISEIISNQLDRSGTSIGVNIEEGDGTHRKKYFKN